MLEDEKPMELQDGGKAKIYIAQYLKNMSEKDMCAVFMIEAGNIADIAQKAEQKENIVHHAEQALSQVFKGTDIVSQLGNHDFIVFHPGDITEEEAAGKAKALCEQIFSGQGNGRECHEPSYIGVYLAHGGGISFEKLFGQVVAALYEAKKSRQENYYILNDRKMPKFTTDGEKRDITGISVSTLFEYMDSGVSLIEVGPEIQVIYASHSLYHMLGIDRGALPLPRRLSEIGIHPDYEADYENTLREGIQKEGIIEHIHKISTNGKDWIWRHVRAMKIEYPGSREPVLMELSTNISWLVRTERRLRVSNERLRTAFRQTPYVLWEVDTEDCIFSIYNVDEEKCEQNTIVGGFPQSFLDKGIVHPDSAAAFLEFSEKLMSGVHAGRGNFMMRDHVSHSYGWVTMSYRMTYNEEGSPLKAVGVWSKFPELPGIGSSVMRRRSFPETARRHLIIRMKINLTKDAVEEFWMGGMDQTAWTWGKTYSGLIDSGKHCLFAKSDQKRFQERYRREQLLQDYEEGRLWSEEEYQNVDEAGVIGWVMDLVNLVKDERSGDICMYACGLDSGLRHDWEKSAGAEIRRDTLTGLYTTDTAKDIVKYLLREKNESQYAFSLIDITGRERQGYRTVHSGGPVNGAWNGLCGRTVQPGYCPCLYPGSRFQV